MKKNAGKENNNVVEKKTIRMKMMMMMEDSHVRRHNRYLKLFAFISLVPSAQTRLCSSQEGLS